MKIAAQLYTLRDYLKTPEDIGVTLKKVKEMGYNAVQASGIGPIENAAFKALADEAGLEICATHIPFSDMTDKLETVIANHKAWNCKYVGIGGLPANFRESADGYRQFAAQANDVSRKLKDAGLQFVYHNHAFEFTRFGGTSDKTGMDILFEESDPATFGFELDVFWVLAGGADPVEWINKVNGRMQVVHLKDYAVTPSGERRYAEIGEGNMNFARILEACEATGVEYGAVEQDLCYERDPLESLAISVKNLKALGAKF